MTSTSFSAMLILGSCLVVSGLLSNDAGVPYLLFRDVFVTLSLGGGGGLFFFSIRPSDPKSGNAFDAKRKKKVGGWGGWGGVSELH